MDAPAVAAPLPFPWFEGGGMLAWGVAGCVAAGAAVWVLRLARSRQGLKARVQAANSELDELRDRDALTGLATRPAFEAALEESLDAPGDRKLALLVVGLDDFRLVNEAYGHRAGDRVLIEAAARLQALEPGAHSVARLGGDEFTLLLTGDARAAVRAAAGIVQALRRPIDVEGLELQVAASVGIALYPDHGARPRLLGHAGIALRAVKQGGGAGHAMFDPAMGVDQRERAELLQALRHAVQRRELQLVYQPKIDARSLQITAVEALLRWQHPQRGVVSPAVFIPLAERHGLIGEIGRWVIEEACRQAAEWRGRGLRMRMAVNISGHQLRHDDLIEQVEGALRRNGIPPERLTCEITESVAMEDTSQTRAAFERLRRAGLHVSIDDFGTGHSSLASLRRLPAAELKIDRAFVADLANGDRATSIVQAVVRLARGLGLRVVAEGVETEAQRDALVALGCDELQGYLFAKPMGAAALALWAEGESPGGGPAVQFRASLFDPTAPVALQ